MVISFSQTMYFDSATELPASAMLNQIAIDNSSNTTYKFNGTAWLPLDRATVKKSTVTVNGKTAGAVKIYTLETVTAGLKFYPTQIIIRAVTITGATLKPTLSVGTNATAYDNIAAGSLLNSVTSLLGITTQPQNVSTSPALDGGSDIYANISIGALATTYTFKIDILGYYEA